MHHMLNGEFEMAQSERKTIFPKPVYSTTLLQCSSQVTNFTLKIRKFILSKISVTRSIFSSIR